MPQRPGRMVCFLLSSVYQPSPDPNRDGARLSFRRLVHAPRDPRSSRRFCQMTPARRLMAGVRSETIHLGIGIEDINDIILDLDQAPARPASAEAVG